MNPVISNVRSVFPMMFLLTLITLASDVLLTPYAVRNFGLEVEANKVVAPLIGSERILAWLGDSNSLLLFSQDSCSSGLERK